MNKGPDAPGLPRERVDSWLREQVPELSSGNWSAEVISGGLSNITYRLQVPDRTLILRRPPLAGIQPGAHDMAREFRVMSALAGTGVPVPRMIALCSDERVLGQPFYLMADVAGRVLRTRPDTAPLTPADRAELTENLVAVLVRLHQVDASAVGLLRRRPDSRPPTTGPTATTAVTYPQRLLARWATQWAACRTRELPDLELLLTRLADRVAALPAVEPVVLHGDYRLDNVIVAPEGERPGIAAVVDWELSTTGDPLADLALCLTYQELGRTAGPSVLTGGAMDQLGFGLPEQFGERYAQLAGADLSPLPVHLALAALKLAVIAEGVHARYLGGQTVSAGYEGVGEVVPVLAARGLALLAG